MGLVQGYTECPRCHKGQCHEDYNYNTGESNKICFDCGYIHQKNYKKDEEGNYLIKDPNQGFLYSNLIVEELKIDNPYGVLYITFKENLGSQINTIVSVENYNEVVKACKNNTDNRIESVIVKRYLPGKDGKRGRFKTIELLKEKKENQN